MDVGDLFQLQRAFKSDRVLIATAQEEGVVLLREVLCQRFNTFVLGEHLLDTVRQRLQAMHDILLDRGIQTLQAAQLRHQHQQHGELGGEGFGRRHTDLCASVGHQRQIGFTYQRGARHVTDRQRTEVAQLFGEAQRGQGVRRLTRLGEGDHQAVAAHGGFAIAEFRGDFHVARDTGQRFKPVA